MRVGLIDVDGHNFPNLCLMKISAHHKAHGDNVEWWNGMTRYDIVYKSRVFDDTYTPDFTTVINADKVVSGGTGYDLNNRLPPEIEACCPDYTIYPKFTEAYGFLTRGCPRNCPFCIVTKKEGSQSVQVSDLAGFYRGQREIKLLDPNLLACKGHEELLLQLIDSNAWVDFTQGLDARLLNRDNIQLLQKVKKKMVHFAWDGERESEQILKNLLLFKEMTEIDRRNASVYVLTNYDTDFSFDLYRVETLRKIGYDPYVMIYNKNTSPQNVRHLQRWVNNKIIWTACDNFADYNPKIG